MTLSARPSVADPDLKRPDWLTGTPRDPKLLWLDKNENRDPAQLQLVSNIMSGLNSFAYSTYPEATKLYRKLGEWVGVDPHCLMLAAGSDVVIRSVFEAFISPGDGVVITEPTFAMYPVYTRMYGGRMNVLTYRASDRGPLLRYQDVVSAITSTKPRLVCLPNPNSPTGTVFAIDELRKIIEAAVKADAVLLIDEAYHPFCSYTAVPLIAEYSHLIIARTTAKAWGMAGLRIGYSVASPEATSILHKVRPMYECGTIGVAAFEAILDHVEAMLASVTRLDAGKKAFLRAMHDLGLRTLDTDGNFMHVAFGRHAERVHTRLASICYYRRDFSDPCLKGFSRFSSTTPELFHPVIEGIRESVGGKQYA